MAIAKKCDRCGKFYEVYNKKEDNININKIMSFNIYCNTNYFNNVPIDLCPECKDSFNSWFKKEGE